MRTIVIWSSFRSAITAALLISVAATGAALADPNPALSPVVVAAVQGAVTAAVDGKAMALKVGATVDLPAVLRTGADGSIELHQGLTIIKASANSQLEIPKAVYAEERIERIIQSKGNVFYNVAKRPIRKLSVETPYLVAVIKGTQFNVAAKDDSTTLSLLEGHIELHADTQAVDLLTGQMATRSAKVPMITVIKMDTGEILRTPGSADAEMAVASTVKETPGLTSVAPTSATVDGAADPADHAIWSTVPADDHGASSSLALAGLVNRTSAIGAQQSTTVYTNSSSTTGASAATTVGNSGSSGSLNSGSVSTGSVGTTTTASTATGATVGGSSTGTSSPGSTGTSVAANVGVGTGTSIGTTVGAGTSTTGTGISASVGANVSTGSTGVSSGVSTSVGASGTGVGASVGTGTSASTGGTSTSVGTTVAANVGSTTGTTVSTSAGTTVAGTTTAASTTTKTGTSSSGTGLLDLSLTLGSNGISATVDVGGNSTTVSAGSTSTGSTVTTNVSFNTSGASVTSTSSTSSSSSSGTKTSNTGSSLANELQSLLTGKK